MTFGRLNPVAGHSTVCRVSAVRSLSALPIRSVADRLRLSHRAAFLGRQPEIAAFHQLLRPDSPHALLVVEGPAGIGKTALLARFADEARAAGRPVLRVDGRDGDE